jgi:hypothetical protein
MLLQKQRNTQTKKLHPKQMSRTELLIVAGLLILVFFVAFNGHAQQYYLKKLFAPFSFFGGEGFANPAPTVVTELPGFPENLIGADANVVGNEKLLTSETLHPFSQEDAMQNWSRMTSEKCLRTDAGEVLKPVGSYLQRTNNYKRTHPDDCSAPNHEFVGTFYKPHEGVGASPASGLPLPPSTQCA